MGKSSVKTFYKPFYGITVRGMLGCALPNNFERPIQPSASERFFVSDMGWTHHGAEGHHKAVLIAHLEALLQSSPCTGSQQKRRCNFVEEVTYFLTCEICRAFLTSYCCVLLCLSDTVSSDKKTLLYKTGTPANIVHVVVGTLCLHSAANKCLSLKAF